MARKVNWKRMLAGDLSEAEKEALLARGRDLVRNVRERVKGMPDAVLKRMVNEAVEEIRRQQAG